MEKEDNLRIEVIRKMEGSEEKISKDTVKMLFLNEK